MPVEMTRLSSESAYYVKMREELRLAELELIEQRERVAQMRRALPPGPALADYKFLEGPSDLANGDTPVRTVRLSELCSAPDRPLIIYHLMYGKAQTEPCPMCTLWIDGFNGIAQHITQNVDFVVAAAADPTALRAHARNRGWDQLRLLSCGDSTFKYDLKSEDPDGSQDSTISVFTHDADGTVYHRYTAHPWIDDNVRERGIDAMCAVWHLLDLTPQGRGDWYSSLAY
jgi:predicted dithiol-disulfide oxidoreductase (DUF899 family)